MGPERCRAPNSVQALTCVAALPGVGRKDVFVQRMLMAFTCSLQVVVRVECRLYVTCVRVVV